MNLTKPADNELTTMVQVAGLPGAGKGYFCKKLLDAHDPTDGPNPFVHWECDKQIFEPQTEDRLMFARLNNGISQLSQQLERDQKKLDMEFVDTVITYIKLALLPKLLSFLGNFIVIPTAQIIIQNLRLLASTNDPHQFLRIAKLAWTGAQDVIAMIGVYEDVIQDTQNRASHVLVDYPRLIHKAHRSLFTGFAEHFGLQSSLVVVQAATQAEIRANLEKDHGKKRPGTVAERLSNTTACIDEPVTTDESFYGVVVATRKGVDNRLDRLRDRVLRPSHRITELTAAIPFIKNDDRRR